MDTISRENNSVLPIAGVIAGVLGVLLGGIALIQLSKLKAQVAEQEAKVALIDGIKATADAAATKAELKGNVDSIVHQTQEGFNTVTKQSADLAERVTKIEENLKKPAPAPGKGGGAVVAGPGEYVVKQGDVSGAKIARDHGVALADLIKVNPGVNWSKLHPGMKVKLPVKAPAAAAK